MSVDRTISSTLPEPSSRNGVRSPWFKPIEAAEYLGIALGTLRNWTSAHYIPHAKRGRLVRYHRDSLDQWLKRGACVGRAKFTDLCEPHSRLRKIE